MHRIVGRLLIFEHPAATSQDHRAVTDVKRFDIDQSLSSHTLLNTREGQNSTLLTLINTSFLQIWFYSLKVCNIYTYFFWGLQGKIIFCMLTFFTIQIFVKYLFDTIPIP